MVIIIALNSNDFIAKIRALNNILQIVQNLRYRQHVWSGGSRLGLYPRPFYEISQLSLNNLIKIEIYYKFITISLWINIFGGKCRSTETPLLYIGSNLLLSVDIQEAFTMVLLDLSATFESVDHEIQHHLQCWYGVTSSALQMPLIIIV